MGKRAKGKRAEEKKQQKKAAKAARMTMYAGFAKLGKTKKTRRALKKARSVLTPSIKHAIQNCGNPGCDRCAPLLIGVKSED